MVEYKYYADEYLALNDIFSDMTQLDQVMFSLTSGFKLLGDNEIPYITGDKKALMRNIAWMLGVNRVYRSDPKKYKEVFLRPNRRYKVTFVENGTIAKPNNIAHNMFQ